jgi:hypothetical protein
MRAFTGDEITGLLDARVGPIGHHEQHGPGSLALDTIISDVADRAAVIAMLDAELDGGGPETGFLPARSEDGELMVSFVSVVAQASRP